MLKIIERRLVNLCFKQGFIGRRTIRYSLFTTSAKKQTYKESKFHLLLLWIPLTAFGLGTWQVFRLQWKKGLIKEMEQRTTTEPLTMPDNVEDLDVLSLEYRRITLTGKFDHAAEIHVMPRSLNDGASAGGLGKKPKSGAHIFTPLVLTTSGQRILVNRGWVPMKRIKAEKRLEGQIEGEIQLVAYIRKNEKRAPFAPKNNIPMNCWHFRDVEAMAEIANCLPIQVDADATSTVPGGPIGGQTRVYLRNEHLQYIVTWYALSAATAYMYYKLRKKPHSSFG